MGGAFEIGKKVFTGFPVELNRGMKILTKFINYKSNVKTSHDQVLESTNGAAIKCRVGERRTVMEGKLMVSSDGRGIRLAIM